ncbi:hypothetical protein N7519_000198 [Penicillium mononematosum]|uniref:uncharacterized protein n=1 Tax=Penicillium mononematosum TaxID=268346 RepID=UPI0025468B59|nr:uncharacterized protein N7519_000198 [Penicillium mononematosum]KAJ6190177.1 hypothetical protein N7519_000198 [Penicillium mononematosum]
MEYQLLTSKTVHITEGAVSEKIMRRIQEPEPWHGASTGILHCAFRVLRSIRCGFLDMRTLNQPT